MPRSLLFNQQGHRTKDDTLKHKETEVHRGLQKSFSDLVCLVVLMFSSVMLGSPCQKPFTRLT